MRDTLPCLFLWVSCRNASLLLVQCWPELPAGCSSHWFCCSSIGSCWHGKSSVFMGLGANTSWERKTNPCLVGDSACVISIYDAKGMTEELNAQTSQCALYPGNSLQWVEGAEICFSAYTWAAGCFHSSKATCKWLIFQTAPKPVR